MMDSNEVLTEIRTLASKVSSQAEEVRRSNFSALQTEVLADVAMSLASRVWLLDSHLSAGGTPPEVWREGPDYVRPLDADPAPSELGRELHGNGVHTHCPAHCLDMWDDDGNDRTDG